jgi:cyclomaltodextrinase / maltogenic alpha-amylase / neopullulanase
MTKTFFYLLLLIFIGACSTATDSTDKDENTSTATHHDWSYNLSIYEVNTRQYTAEGTFAAFASQLDRLADMGAGILWFMPIQPIGVKNRLGTLGSPYAVKDYRAVNPEFGTMADFQDVVTQAHARGMYVMLDWVANHTAWDNTLTETHPEWYLKDNNGNFMAPPGSGWTDVIQLDYSSVALRQYMINTMQYWINETDIDGFRCDAVSLMPTDFWSQAIKELKKTKAQLLMLAEADGPQYRTAGFDMTYGWGLYGFGNGLLPDIVAGFNDANDLDNYLKNERTIYGNAHYRMYFTSNHDENSWYGTEKELFAAAAPCFNVLTAVLNGMQLIYNGQEAGLDKRLAFFDKDEIPWREHPNNTIYKTLLHLKKENKALWNGSAGGPYKRISNSTANDIFTFMREKENDKIFALFNLTTNTVHTVLTDTLIYGSYVDVFSADSLTFSAPTSLTLSGWEYHIYRNLH